MTSGKVCVVAEVGPGVGKACCELYASKGYRVVMMARRQRYLDELAATLPDTTVGFAIDLAEEARVQQAFAEIHARFGAADVLIYNAARGSFGGFLDIDPVDLEKNFSVNTMGLLYCARAAAPRMIERGKGYIIVTGNTAATRGGAKFAAFAPSKAAARSLTQRLWDEKLDISHAFRSLKECIDEAFSDIRTRTTLLEARYLARQ